MSNHITKSHNRTLLLYHLVFPVKYRKKIFTKAVTNTLKEVCLGISARYEIEFIEIGADEDHVHFLVQGVPVQSVEQQVRIIKSITAKHVFGKHPEIKEKLWGGNFWTSGYYANTVGRHGNEEVIRNYVREQGKEYEKIYGKQLSLF